MPSIHIESCEIQAVTNKIVSLNKEKGVKKFAEYWKDKGYEKGQSQTFWIELLQKVLGVESPTKSIEFEKPVIVEKKAEVHLRLCVSILTKK